MNSILAKGLISQSALKKVIISQRVTERNVLVAIANTFYGRKQIGKREVVGFGITGSYIYFDKPDFPMPAIRFREDDDYIKKLREKEKGDWKKLTIDEKKALYRASFCSTIAEISAPTGEWKSVAAGVLFLMATSLWVFAALKIFFYPGLPPTMSKEAKFRQLREKLILQVDPIDGISSKWDYDNNRWKK
ncbi:cytochrome c oxidase polypeptide IV-like protein [Dinothrombium tinctorium]|uniref:Cytochrome c oxidase subunit 4 n=1 Tax=Dinothrombium tinctorium TaxID=1965070 RepID=A0A443QT84_9ACAR|nr:cytochrome c oxidase polypeptide IV-like protein [Dinothrombium tinctorium]